MAHLHGTAKANTSDTIEVTAMATDQDTDDMLTYTLWYGTTADNITTKGVSSSPTKQGTSVTLTQTGLPNMDTTYYFKVVVSDTLDEATSAQSSAKTYCLGTYCSGGYYTYPTCGTCNGSKIVNCTTCNAQKLVICNSCNGLGSWSCNGCSGQGHISCNTCNGLGRWQNGSQQCWTCGGRGTARCPDCGGSGIDTSSTGLNGKCRACRGSGEMRGKLPNMWWVRVGT